MRTAALLSTPCMASHTGIGIRCNEAVDERHTCDDDGNGMGCAGWTGGSSARKRARAAARAGAGPRQGRFCRGQPPGRDPAPGLLSAAARCLAAPRAGNCRTGGGHGPGRDLAVHRHCGLCAGRGRRLCRILHRRGRPVPSGAYRAADGASCGNARDAVYRVAQRVRARHGGRGRNDPRSRRNQRHRLYGDPPRQAVRGEGDRHLWRAGKVRAGACHRRCPRDRLQGGRLRRGNPAPDRRPGRAHGAGHGRGRLCRAQPQVPRRRRTPRDHRGAGRRAGGKSTWPKSCAAA